MSDKLSRHLQLRTPLLWVTSDEAVPVIDEVAASSERPVYRMNIINGLQTFSNNRWVTVLVPDEEAEHPEMMIPIRNFSEAMNYVMGKSAVMIIENAHNVVEPLLAFMDHISEQWYRGFDNDDEETMPMTLVLISYKGDIPPELKRIAVHHAQELPTEEDLAEVVKAMRRNGELAGITRRERKLITRAGVGMSRFEFLHTAANSLADHGTINHEMINAAKLAILAKDGVLTMRVPTMTMEQIGGMDHAKHIMERTVWCWNHPEEAAKLKVKPLRKILLMGVPGSGKSAICEATATALNLELAKFGVSQMMNKFVGESEANMRRAFAQIKTMSPLCLWIDELGRDFSGGQSSGSVDGGTTDRVHGEMLQGLQELPENVFLVAAANRIEDLPPEMLRSGRFDKILFVGFPTASERVDIFRIHLEDDADNFDLNALAMATPNFTGAEIKALIAEARFEYCTNTGKPLITAQIMELARTMRGLIWNNHREAIQAMYRKALSEWDWASTEQYKEALVQYGSNNATKRRPTERRVPSLTEGGSFFG